MATSVDFSTITEMFGKISEKYSAERRPVLMHKSGGVYRGIAYIELYNRVEACALAFRSLGIAKGDRVALISENRPEWVIADMGMIHLGAVNVPLYPTMTPKQFEFIFNNAGVRVAIVSNQTHLAKVMKIIGEVPTLEKIIVMGEAAGGDSRVLSLPSLLEGGEKERATHPGFLSGAAKDARPSDLLTIIYTSGTTGNPKGVMLTHRNLATNITASAAQIAIRYADYFLSFLPLCHSFERMAGYYTAMACGATIAYAESVEKVSENLVEVRPTVMTSVPRLFERMHSRILKNVESQSPMKQKIFHWGVGVGKRYALARRAGSPSLPLSLQRAIADKLVYGKLKARTGGRVRFFVSGGAPLAPELGEFFEAVGITVVEGYGLSETSPVISVNELHDYKFGTVGRPIPGIEVKIAGDGEILVRGPNVMKGYWNDPQATSETIDREGWLHTGDIGLIDADGFLKITDRKKHLFVSSGGKNIAPQPIENLFLQSKYVDQFMLIGDRRMYCTALIVPEFEALKARVPVGGEESTGSAGTIETPAVVKFFEEEIGAIQKDLPNYERVRKFTLLRRPFTVEGGELTPTLKIKRRVVEETYKEIIERMYGKDGMVGR